MLDLVLAEKVFNHVGGNRAALVFDNLSRVPKFATYILLEELNYILFCCCLNCLGFSPLSQIVSAHNDVLIFFRKRVLAYMGLTQVQKSYLAKQLSQLPALSATPRGARTEVSPKVVGEGAGTKFPHLWDV